MKRAFENIFVKMGVILVLILLLLIPAVMVEGLIRERMNRQNEAAFEVSQKHALQQSFVGPILTIPYKIPMKSKQGDKEIITYKTGNVNVLPEDLNITGDVAPEIRNRGLFKVVLYSTDLNASGNFAPIERTVAGIDTSYLQMNNAYVTVGISDLKGVKNQVKIKLNDSSIIANPGIKSGEIVSEGLHVNYPITESSEGIKFDFDLQLNGSEFLGFAPIGKETKVQLKSPWENPSFTGNFLPIERNVSKDGFDAKWKILNLNRNYPQEWRDKQYNINNSKFGVDLKNGVDVYQKSMRVAKYALLFIILTYLVFFFVEVMNRILIHPIQYILVGIALVLFYVLLLAFSEQIEFDKAYLLSAGMIISLILLYCRSILKSWALAIMTALILLILYTFIFILIQLQDYALLFGSLGIFVVLAVTMFFSRKIDWFEITASKEEKIE